MIKVLLCDDHLMVREGIRALLQSTPDLQVVAEAADGREAVRLATELHPDLALIDVAMPNLNGIEATRQIRALAPATRILMLSMQTDAQYVQQALRAGASGYVLKQAAFEELVTAFRSVLTGAVYLSPAVASGAVKASPLTPARKLPASDLEKLSSREREVLQMTAEGNSANEIATHLGLSVRTVETYRSRIMLKLGQHSIADLTRFAIRSGVCSME